MKSTKELIDERNRLIAENRKLYDGAAGKLNSEQGAEYDKRDKDIDELSDEIQRRHADENRSERHQRYDKLMEAAFGRQTEPGEIDNRERVSEAAAARFDFGKAGILKAEDLAELDPQLSARLAAMASPKYAKTFGRYLRGARGDWEKLGLFVGDDSKGGYTAPIDFLTRLIKFTDDLVAVRRLATVLPPTSAKSVGALSYDTDYNDADWTAEVPAADIAEDDTARFGKRELTPHLLTKLVKTSRKLLRSSTLPVENFLAQRLAYKFAITENKAFMTGNGVNRPFGLFIASANGIPTSRDTAASSTTDFTADNLIDLQHSVKDVYRQNGTWLGSREFRKRCRKLKDGEGRYLLTMNNASGIDVLFDRPLVMDENAPNTFTTGQYVALFGDFSFYWIQDGIDLLIQRLDELFALRNQVGWLGRKETDAMPVLGEAFARLKLA
jgi:HK97 family phage major capsid protein